MNRYATASYLGGAMAELEAIERAKRTGRYPGVTRWSINDTGPVPVARPARVSAVALQQERLTRRLQEITQQEQAYLDSRLRVIARAR